MWFIIRHGETMHNRKGIKQGCYPSLLTLRGIDQIKSIAYRLVDSGLDFRQFKFVVSPMVRTRHSMQIILEILGLEDDVVPVEEPLLKAIDAGIYTNTPKNMFYDIFENYDEMRKDLDFKFEDGESKMEAIQRLMRFYDKYYHEQNLVVVGHGSLGYLINHIKSIYGGETGGEYLNLKMNQNYFFCINNDTVEMM